MQRIVKIKRYITLILLLFFLLIYFIFFRENYSEKLTKQGNELIEKIENYRNKNGELPTKLSDLKIEEKDESPLYYDKKDSQNYIIWFGTTVGESKTYYSNSKTWSDK